MAIWHSSTSPQTTAPQRFAWFASVRLLTRIALPFSAYFQISTGVRRWLPEWQRPFSRSTPALPVPFGIASTPVVGSFVRLLPYLPPLIQISRFRLVSALRRIAHSSLPSFERSP